MQLRNKIIPEDSKNIDNDSSDSVPYNLYEISNEDGIIKNP